MLLGIVCAALAAVGADSTTDSAYRAQIEAWRAAREASLKADGGWLTVAGLFWLKDGPNSFGSTPDNDIRLPASAPARAGVFLAEPGRVRLRLEAGVAAQLAGQAVTEAELWPDSENVLVLGRLTLQLIERGGRRAIRLKDIDSPARRAFQGLAWFPVDEAYRVTARFLPSEPPQRLPIVNVLGQVVDMPSPGVAVFELGGRELRLTPVLESPEAKELFFIFRDETSGRETYGAGRYLYAAPAVDGRLVLDFNKAYSPPCAFTEFATCPLPPPQNRLRLRVEAGERSPGPAHDAGRGPDPPRFGETLDATAETASGDPGPATVAIPPARVLSLAGGADNVFRTLQTLPGVAGAEEFGSRLSVRGGSPDQNSMRSGLAMRRRLGGNAVRLGPAAYDHEALTCCGV